MSHLTRKAASLLVFCLSTIAATHAQDAVPVEILQRTLKIEIGTKQGTGFWVDHEGRGYLVTARHMVEGLPLTNTHINIWQDGTRKELNIEKVLFPKSNSVDIAVLESNLKVDKPYEIRFGSKISGVTMGQQVWFLGYPFGIETQWRTMTAPFIKRGTMSAIDARDPDAVLMYIDGFNNEGFSGGPVVYWSFAEHKYAIAAVVKGYKTEAAKVVVNGVPVNTQLMVNSGILIGYGVDYVNQAIENAK